MSFCRWSSNDFDCDIYSYWDASQGGITTHIAGRRVIGEIPKVPDLLKSPIKDFVKAHRKQMKFLETCEREEIKLPFAGETFNDPDLKFFLKRLLELKEIGYHIPEDVIETVREEIKESS
jgi:hypothetical protein